jgi:phosphatidylinositol alpha-1,6-mannosyltransferase
MLIDAAALLAPTAPDLEVLIAGSGRDLRRLERRAERASSPVRFLGRVADDELAELHAAADVFAMLCRDRWSGLEQEGFGIVFLEAGSAGVATIAGRSGGSAEAVIDGRTGIVLDDPGDVVALATAIEHLMNDDRRRAVFGLAARQRILNGFTYEQLAEQLHLALERPLERPLERQGEHL